MTSPRQIRQLSFLVADEFSRIDVIDSQNVISYADLAQFHLNNNELNGLLNSSKTSLSNHSVRYPCAVTFILKLTKTMVLMLYIAYHWHTGYCRARPR